MQINIKRIDIILELLLDIALYQISIAVMSYIDSDFEFTETILVHSLKSITYLEFIKIINLASDKSIL